MKIVALVFTVAVATAEKKPVEWKTAKVLEVSSESYTTKGGSTSTKDYYGNIHTTDSTWRHLVYSYVLEAGPKIITVSERLSWRWSKPVGITAGDEVQYRECGRETLCVLTPNQSKEKKLYVDRVALAPQRK